MKRLLTFFSLSLAAAISYGATLTPIQLLNPAGSAAGQAIVSQGASTAPAWGIVGIAGGGTGASTASAALTSLGAAALASPTFTGTPAAPTAAPGTSTTQIATTAFATTAVANQAALSAQPAFQAYRSTTQSLTIGAATKMQFDTKVFDTNAAYDNTTNYRFTPQKAGKYMVRAVVSFTETTTAASNLTAVVQVFKNGATYLARRLDGYVGAATTIIVAPESSGIVSMNGTTDYIEAFATLSTASSGSINGGTAPMGTYFEAFYIGP